MPRPKSEHGRRVPVSFKISEPEAVLLDSVRGGTERSVWLRDAALSVLQGSAPAPVKRPRGRAQPAGPDPDEQQRVLDDFSQREADGTPRRRSRAATAVPIAPETPAEPPQAVFSGPVAKTAAEVAAQLETVQSRGSGHAQNCKCFVCKPPGAKK